MLFWSLSFFEDFPFFLNKSLDTIFKDQDFVRSCSRGNKEKNFLLIGQLMLRAIKAISFVFGQCYVTIMRLKKSIFEEPKLQQIPNINIKSLE